MSDNDKKPALLLAEFDTPGECMHAAEALRDAAAASAEPSPKVKEMMKLTLMPMSAAAFSLKDTARMAVPTLVFCTMNVSATRSSSVVMSTMT